MKFPEVSSEAKQGESYKRPTSVNGANVFWNDSGQFCVCVFVVKGIE